MAVERTLTTDAGAIACLDNGVAGPAVLFVHGNSANKEAWRRQFESVLAAQYRLIAIDLPGHGASVDAADPKADYSMPGYARVALSVLAQLGIGQAAVVGWSLGGHIGIEMIAQGGPVAGLLTTGTPPVSNESDVTIGAGFHMNETTVLAGQEVLSDEEARRFAHAAMGLELPLDEAALEGVRRTDGRARALMFAAFMRGEGANQKAVVESSDVPFAVVNGAEEFLINNGYYETVRFKNLWSGQVHFIADAGHAPFWSKPDAFNALLARFLSDALTHPQQVPSPE